MKFFHITALALCLNVTTLSHGMDDACSASIIQTGMGLLGTAGAAVMRHRAKKTVTLETERIRKSYDEEKAENEPEESVLTQNVRRPMEMIDAEERRVVHEHTHWDLDDIKSYTKMLCLCCCFTLYMTYDATQTCSSHQK